MWKKMLPAVVLSGVLLVGCNNNDNDTNTVPNKNETPMEDVRDDARELKDDVERDFEGRNYDNGTINERNDQNDMNQDTTPDDNLRNRDNMDDNELPKEEG